MITSRFTLRQVSHAVSAAAQRKWFALSQRIGVCNTIVCEQRNFGRCSPQNGSVSMSSRPHNADAFPWGQVQQLEYQEANTGTIVQACHAMIYAKTDAKFVSQLPCKAWVLMQMRFDGKLGFPGGVVSDLTIPDATLEDGLNRELEEEVALDLRHYAFTKRHYVVSHFCPKANLILNFYAQEVTEEQFKEIEANALKADEYGHECLGVVRIPLYTLQDGHNGLPAFLQNQFAGTSVLQVIIGLCSQNLLKPDELNAIMPVLPKHQSYRRLIDQALSSFRDRDMEDHHSLRVPDKSESRAISQHTLRITDH